MLFRAPPTDRLLLIIHHLAVDSVSWRILLEDLTTLCQPPDAGPGGELPAKTSSFQAWAQHLGAWGRSPDAQRQLAYWQAVPWEQVQPLPVDGPHASSTVGEVATVSATLSEADTRALLQEIPPVYRTQVHEVLLTGLAQTLSAWSGQASVLVAMEGHGRETEGVEGMDLSRTVGWFTSLYPLLLTLPSVPQTGNGGEGVASRWWAAALKGVKEQVRALPRRGVGYGVLRYGEGSSEGGAVLASQPQPQVSFNYLGQFDPLDPEGELFGVAPEAEGPIYAIEDRPGRDETRSRQHHFDVVGYVTEGRLQVVWQYSRQVHSPSTVEGLAQGFVEALRGLIAHCRTPDAGGFTPSDFPLAGLDQQATDKVTGEIPYEIEDIYPLSPTQRGILYHILRDSTAGLYCIQLHWNLQGELHVPRFRQAWNQVLDTHAILRSTVVWEGLDEPLQVVGRGIEMAWEEFDWSQLNPEEQSSKLQAFLRADRKRGFELSKPPLMRMALVRLSQDRYRCIWTSMHLITEGWSTFIALGEVFAVYASLCGGPDASLPARRPYRDYIGWLQRQDLTRGETFWRRQLAGFTTPVHLPADARPEPVDQAARYHRQVRRLSPAQTAALKTWCGQHGLTLNTLILGAWALVLSRYSGRDDVLFGTTMSGRPAELEGVESMVGLFINTLPVRVRRQPADRVGAWLQALQQQQVEMRQYEYCSLTQVHKWSEMPAGTPLFEHIFVFENYPVDGDVLDPHAGVRIDDVHSEEQTNYPLTVVAVPGAELSLAMLHDRQRIGDGRVAQLLNHLHRAVLALAVDADRPLETIPLLSAEEEMRLLAWKGERAAYPSEQSLAVLFERQVEKTPNAVAVIDGPVTWSYKALNEKANRIAHGLQQAGIKPGDRVAVRLERGAAFVAAVVGIVKAGGAYVPLDLNYPVERVGFMVGDSGARLLLTQADLAAAIDPFPVPSVPVEDWMSAAELLSTNPSPMGNGGWEAYVMYTSGSTGIPKGSVVSHQSVSRLVLETNYISFCTGDWVSQISNVSFDAATFEVWGSLLNGSGLVVVPHEVILSSAELEAFIDEHRLDIAFLPTALFNQLGGEHPSMFGRLRFLVIGGDVLDVGVGDVREGEVLVGFGEGQFHHAHGKGGRGGSRAGGAQEVATAQTVFFHGFTPPGVDAIRSAYSGLVRASMKATRSSI